MNININKVKIFVTVPIKNLDDVRNAIYETEAGTIGSYTKKGRGKLWKYLHY